MIEIPKKGICVDAGTEGNPGNCFYRGLILETGEIIFEETLGMGTNNIGEFLALVHAIHYCRKNNISPDIYSDSKTAMAWVRNKSTNTSFKGEINARLSKAVEYLNSKPVNLNILKWDTKNWGEIPADFGRK
jgi:ribonuclease HI